MTPDAREKAACILGRRAQYQVPLGPLSTYRVGGPAALLVGADDAADLAAVSEAVRASGLPVLVVGKGSNLLVADAGFDGIAVVLGQAFASIDLDAENSSGRAGAAAALPVVARQTAAAGLRGFEWAVGVPGSIGGAVRMNAGGHGSDMQAVLAWVRLFDLATGQDEEVTASDLGLGYRRSSLRPDQVVIEASLNLSPGDPVAAGEMVREIVRWRRDNQPGGQNAGSVFTNPPGDSAGRLVEAAGAKGLRIGTAQVSPKHANFIQADPGGSADDVAALIGEVVRRVESTTGIRLRPELRMVGFDANPRPEVES